MVKYGLNFNRQKALHNMSRKYQRTPRDYQGTKLTTHHVKDLLPYVLNSFKGALSCDLTLISSAWLDVVGTQVASMTQIISLTNGFLSVRVKNSMMFSLLSQYEKIKILEKLRIRFPSTEIKDIVFRMG